LVEYGGTVREIRTEIEIAATAARVWEILTDLKAYPSWNSFLRDMRGEIREGECLSMCAYPPGGRKLSFKPTIVRVVPNRELRWHGRLFVPGLFEGEHIFELLPSDERSTRLVHREEFTGLLVPLLWRSMNSSTRQGFEQMNLALKERAEQSAGQS
jgi:hypothetical protein